MLAILAGLLVGGLAAAAIVVFGGGDSKHSNASPGAPLPPPVRAGTPAPAAGSDAKPGAGDEGFSSGDRTGMTEEIRSLLSKFHEDVVERRFQDAWSLLSARKHRQYSREEGYAGWAKNQRTLTPYLDPAGLTVHIDELEADGVARVRLTGMGWSEPGSPCGEWNGLTWVKYEGGAWTYDPGYSATAERRRRWKPHESELLGVGCLAP